MKCDDCTLAVWKRASNGRLHPDKSGRCGWVYPVKALPPVFWWIGAQVHTPSGGQIERGKDIKRCAYKQGRVAPRIPRFEQGVEVSE